MFKKFVIFSQIIFSIFLFLIIFWKSKNYSFSLNDYYLKFYIFAFLILIIALLLLIANDEIFKIYLISVLTIVLCLYSAEFYFYKKDKILEKFSPNYIYQLKTSPDLIKKFKYDFTPPYYKYLQTSKNLEIYPEISKTFVEVDKETLYVPGSVSNKKILFCNENGYYPIVKSDKYGFINDNNLWSKEKSHLIIVGDSWMSTACHNYDDGVAGQFKQKLNEKEINLFPITLSHGNVGPLIQLANIVEYIKKTNPKVILWVYYNGNDFSDLEREYQNSILRKYLDDDNFTQNLAEKNNLITKKLTLRFQNKDYAKKLYNIGHYKFLDFIKLIKFRGRIINYKNTFSNINNTKMFAIFKKTILRANEIANRKNSEFYFVYLPTTWAIDNLSDIDDTNYLKIKKFLITENIKLIDFNEKLKSHPDPKSLMPFRTHGHFNKSGVNFFAEEVLSKLNYN